MRSRARTGIASRLGRRGPPSSPRWAFQRAWWDAYAANAHDETLVIVPADAPPGARSGRDRARSCIATRWSPADALTHTRMRHGRDRRADTGRRRRDTAVFFGASYHADYATILAASGRPACGRRSDRRLPGGSATPDDWDVVDLRRLRCGDPAADALAAALGAREIGEGLDAHRRARGRLPGRDLPGGRRHRRVPRDARQEGAPRDPAQGPPRRGRRRGPPRGLAPIRSPTSRPFIDLHQKRWGDDGLFPATPGGEQSRVFFRRLFELFGPDGPLRLTFLSVGGRRIAAASTSRPRTACSTTTPGSTRTRATSRRAS